MADWMGGNQLVPFKAGNRLLEGRDGKLLTTLTCRFEGRISTKSNPKSLRYFATDRLVDKRFNGFSSVGFQLFLDDLGATAECFSCLFAGLIFNPIADECVCNLANGETVRTA